MRIFIYEYVTGGGLLAAGTDHLHTLRSEGEAMLGALAADFAMLPRTEVHVLRDCRLSRVPLPVNTHFVKRPSDEIPMLATLAAAADWTILIAPEIDGVLQSRTCVVEEAGGRCLSPSSAVIELCADKRKTNRLLRSAGIAVPQSIELVSDHLGFAELPDDFEYPAVIKRVDGAGSIGARVIAEFRPNVQTGAGRWMLEGFVTGTPASAAVLCGPSGHFVLPPFTQHIDEVSLAYQGGSRIVEPSLVERAKGLAAQAVQVLPDPRGYLGVDVVLGGNESGRDDVVIEMNPRHTTSLIGVRAIAQSSLARATLAIATGKATTLDFAENAVSFTADGSVYEELAYA